jgi:hypothetical protein
MTSCAGRCQATELLLLLLGEGLHRLSLSPAGSLRSGRSAWLPGNGYAT